MPDLDQLLAADARECADTDGPPAAFAAAFDNALGVARSRRFRTIGIAAAAVAAATAGSLFAALNQGSDPAPPPSVRLAAYDQVLGAAPGDDGTLYVVGPKDDHTANCTVVPGMTIKLEPSTGGPSAGFAFTIKLPPGTTPTNKPDIHVTPDIIDRGQLYVFTCPTS